jgi:hypothetical protein
MALIVPRPAPLVSWLSRPAQLAEGMRLYRRTPPWLRRPEVALRVASAAVVVWFGVLFVALGAHAARMADPAWIQVGYGAAAALGVAGLLVLLTRRVRAGGALIAAMVVVGQAVAVLSLV